MDNLKPGWSSPPAASNPVLTARYRNDAMIGIDIIYEAAMQGSPGAGEVLRNLAERINERAARWQVEISRR